MAGPPPIPTEIRFPCPHCARILACDRAYRGVTIDCPACSRPLEVPGSGGSATSPSLRLAPRPPSVPRARATPPPLDVWTQREWDRRLRTVQPGASATGRPSVDTAAWPLLLVFPLLIVGPPALFLTALWTKARWLQQAPEIMIALAVFTALGGGWAVARQATVSPLLRGFLTVAFALALGALWLPVALFGGCLVATGALGH